ncbi:AraC family transcriptional regulator [Neptunicella marina]|uniref:Helix-turn-helix domain-containing protein n=1 Tax=Neptunicella marina TaxID=2125989 RepID=A0A8J6IUS4_9ALTE|nr:helix-turn-helix domain-containing protein [Neptunicella marina]MBC3767086.1 helix-turn-helix domain-containing protein [Neptunicella marina]
MSRPWLNAQLAYLGFRHYSPVAELRHWVMNLWSSGYSDPEQKVVSEHVMYPDPGGKLVVHYDDGQYYILLSSSHKPYRKQVDNQHQLAGVHFLPGGMHALLDIEPSELIAEDSLPLVDIAPDMADELQHLLQHSKVSNVQLIQQWLLLLAQRHSVTPGRLQQWWAVFSDSDYRIEALQQRGLSRRTVEREFRRETGFSPLQVTQLLRIRQARELILQAELSLSDIAQQCGFYDQAHFSHIFKRFTMQTPQTYRQRKLSHIYNIRH